MRERHEMKATTGNRGFTLIEVLAAMAVLVVLILALTRMFVSAANITGRGLTTIARNSVGETAMDAIMQDLRSTQKQLLTAKVRCNHEKTAYCRARLAELQREYDAAA